MSIHACILGATGYGGGELLRLLAGHADVTRVDGVSRSQGGQAFHSVHPNLRGVVGGSFSDAPDWAALAAAAQPVLFSSMPHGELATRWTSLRGEMKAASLVDRLLVIDLSGDFRLADPASFERHYGKAHPCPDWLPRFHYGFPERDTKPQGSLLVANPGCFATAIQLALLPLVDLPDPGLVAISAVTGSSGSGAAASATTHHPTRAHDFRAYKLDGHQHLGEIELMFSPAGIRKVSLVTHSAPMVRGIFVTAQFSLPKGMDAASVKKVYADVYRDAPFVRIVEGSPRVAAVVGSNFCDIGIQVNGDTVVVMTALDNLIKGMAGLAIQNMNRALSIPETRGLLQAALYP